MSDLYFVIITYKYFVGISVLLFLCIHRNSGMRLDVVKYESTAFLLHSVLLPLVVFRPMTK